MTAPFAVRLSSSIVSFEGDLNGQRLTFSLRTKYAHKLRPHLINRGSLIAHCSESLLTKRCLDRQTRKRRRCMDELMSEIRPVPEGQIVRFGSFELSIDTGQLKKHGVRVKLQGKSFQILRALVENPGRVVSREELRMRLWPADTFVDFESGLNTAANRLRSALGDSADNPIYIETLPRVGYRFLAPVTTPKVQSTAHEGIPAVPFELEQPTSITTGHLRLKTSSRDAGPRRAISFRVRVAGALVLTLVVGVCAYWFAHKEARSTLAFRQVTFKSGAVGQARFTPDGNGIVYSAEWGGDGSRLYQADLANLDAHDLGYRDAWLAAVSPDADLALFQKLGDDYTMVLEQAPLRGGKPQIISKGVLSVDFGPDRGLCLIEVHGREYSLEFPPGKRLYTTNHWISHARVSPHGDAVAFLEHPIPADDAGEVMLIDTTGRTRVLSSGWASAEGLAWASSGTEVWFTAARSGLERQLMSVDLAGRTRQVMHTPGSLDLEDISKSGDVLLAQSSERMSMSLINLKEGSIQSISRFDWSRVAGISADGDSILFDESGEGGGKGYSVYLYHVRNRVFDRIGDGRAMDLSPDGRWAVTQPADTTARLDIVSVDGGHRSTLSRQGIQYVWAKFLPTSDEILFYGSPPGQSSNLYRQKLHDGTSSLVFEDVLMDRPVIDPGGHVAIARSPGPSLLVLNLGTGAKRLIKINQQVTPVAIANEQKVLIRVHDRGYVSLFLLNPSTGGMTPYRRLSDPYAPQGMVPIFTSRDWSTMVFSKRNLESDLVVASGLAGRSPLLELAKRARLATGWRLQL
jgi:DNA-binding winged helix-turn-helix (wHTH) protein